MKFLVLLFLPLLSNALHRGIPAGRQVSGYVFDERSKAPLAGVHVYIAASKSGGVTTGKGFFSVAVPANDSAVVTFSYVGFASVTRIIPPGQQVKLTVFLTAGQTLDELNVRVSQERATIGDPQMSTIGLSMSQLEKVPSLLGEKDVLKMLQLMPGVQKGSEGNAGLYVRGGAPDQNLILLDNTPVYNPNHLLGFFSAFNGDVLKRVDLTKGGFPARFGGRLSSVVELTTKDGETDKLHGEFTGGLVASRLMVSGPINKRVTYRVAGRRTYLDLLNGLLGQNKDSQPVLKTYFYDVNAKLTVNAGDADKLYISGYASYDRFNNVRADGSGLQSSLQWSNRAGSVRWNHQVSRRLTTDLSMLYSYYGMDISDQQAIAENFQNGSYTLNYRSSIRDLSAIYSLNQYISEKTQLRYGAQLTHHRFNPRATVATSQNVLPVLKSTSEIDAFEGGAYLEWNWTPDRHWRVNSGVRLSMYTVPGPANSPSEATSDSTSPIYIRPEPRLSVAYRLTPTLSMKASYALMNQYLHLLSSTGIGLSTDLWVPTVQAIKPQQSQQLALGMAKEFSRAGLTLTVEGYYKQMLHLVSYREGASFLASDARGGINAANWSENVTTGDGNSYGGELLVQKKAGRFSGWVGYTLSWTTWQFAELNGGRPFHPRNDRRHDASIVGIYELTPSITLAGTWVYGTGNALTLPLSRFSGFSDQQPVSGQVTSTGLYGTGPNVKEYGERNSFRADAYHRLDVSLQFMKKRANYERTWEVSAYNVYNRRNAFLYSLEGVDQGKGMPSRTALYKYALFPVVPSVSYKIRF